MFEKISLAGDLGSGKSTVSAILTKLIEAEYYSTGTIVRNVANERGMTVVELNKYMETHPEIDREIDDGVRALSGVEKRLIIDSRMAWHFTENTFKVYLSTDIETSALRIMNANRQGEHNATLEETIASTRARRASEQKRYMEQYGVDIADMKNYALIIDTTYATPDEIALCIKDGFDRWCEDNSFCRVCLSPLRPLYPDSEPDMSLVSQLSDKLDSEEEIPDCAVAVKDGEFYIVDNHESALAYSLSDKPFIFCALTNRVPSGEYVRMRNTL